MKKITTKTQIATHCKMPVYPTKKFAKLLNHILDALEALTEEEPLEPDPNLRSTFDKGIKNP